ncbi:MAG: hypothetical protein NTU90_05710 [Proteobacteria bacterium]|nr:hypothetical protein [Pseudomonadota bacterium]
MITGIGSFPFTEADEAIDLIFSTCREIPFWPQLPKRSPIENMYIPFLESVPCVIFDETQGTVVIDTEKTQGIEQFYENFYSEKLDAFAISDKMAPGFYRFLERLKEIKDDTKFIKGQLTGPFSMGLGLKDEKGKPIIYNYGFFDMIKKALNMKAKWMIATIKASYPEKDVIIFFDEPYLVSFGSAYVSVSKEDTVALLNEVSGGLKAKRGIHCCGNTDWSVLFNVDTDIINYDAFNFLETIFYFKEDLARFLKKGGHVSPGIVPSSDKVLDTSIDDILNLRENFCESIDTINPETDKIDWLFTTSCGLGSLNPAEAQRSMELLKELSEIQKM